MEHLLFALYLVVLAWLVTKIGFFTKSGLSPSQLVIVLLLKVMAGILYGWIGVYYADMAQMLDTWMYHQESLEEYNLLLSNPGLFVTSFFRSDYAFGYGGSFFSTDNSWWSNLPLNFLIKVLAVLNLLSGGNYYINVIFYSFLTLWGPIAIYRVMKDAFPFSVLPVLIATFLLPSFIYWTSGIHKDGILFTGIALIIYHVYFGFQKGFNWKGALAILFGFLLVVLIRNYILVMLLPALLAWWLAQKNVSKPFYVFSAVYVFCGLLFFTAQYIHPKVDFPAIVVTKQQQFLLLKGNSAVTAPDLKPTLGSFIENAPRALTTSVLRPNVFDIKHLLSLAAAVENIVLLLLFIAFLAWHRKTFQNPFILFCLFFSFSVLLTIGYTVHFLGATVRYRSVVLPLLVIPMFAFINWKKLGQLFLNIKN